MVIAGMGIITQDQVTLSHLQTLLYFLCHHSWFLIFHNTSAGERVCIETAMPVARYKALSNQKLQGKGHH